MARFQSVCGGSARAFAFFWLAVLAGDGRAAAADPSSIRSVSVSQPFFNPTIGQKIRIDLEAGTAGSLTIGILDRDGYLVRKLVSGHPVQAGKVGFDWDGRDDLGQVVPDEAYSLSIELEDGGIASVYLPGNRPGEKLRIESYSYDRPSATLSYRLSQPARVHVQAGVAKKDSKTGLFEGPVLKTLVNREPRPGGAVVENWNGLDESGSFYVPDLSDFNVGIAATSLPENALIAYGNKERTFLSVAAGRSGATFFTYRVEDRHHHNGLTTLEDVSPRLKANVLNATWSAAERTWSTNQRELRVSVSLEGPSSEAFAGEPAEVQIFVDGKKVRQISSPRSGLTAQLSRPSKGSGSNVIAINWISAYGPVAVDAFRLNWGDTDVRAAAAVSPGQ